MLILTRKRDEEILIGDNIVIRIVDVDSGKVRVGIEAPKDIMILRRELTQPPKKKGDAGAAESK